VTVAPLSDTEIRALERHAADTLGNAHLHLLWDLAEDMLHLDEDGTLAALANTLVASLNGATTTYRSPAPFHDYDAFVRHLVSEDGDGLYSLDAGDALKVLDEGRVGMTLLHDEILRATTDAARAHIKVIARGDLPSFTAVTRAATRAVIAAWLLRVTGHAPLWETP